MAKMPSLATKMPNLATISIQLAKIAVPKIPAAGKIDENNSKASTIPLILLIISLFTVKKKYKEFFIN